MTVQIKATKCTGRDLRPGDLFSTADQYYWDQFPNRLSVGERVYIRTNMPADAFPDVDEEIFRITIVPIIDVSAAEPHELAAADVALGER